MFLIFFVLYCRYQSNLSQNNDIFSIIYNFDAMKRFELYPYVCIYTLMKVIYCTKLHTFHFRNNNWHEQHILSKMLPYFLTFILNYRIDQSSHGLFVGVLVLLNFSKSGLQILFFYIGLCTLPTTKDVFTKFSGTALGINHSSSKNIKYEGEFKPDLPS